MGSPSGSSPNKLAIQPLCAFPHFTMRRTIVTTGFRVVVIENDTWEVTNAWTQSRYTGSSPESSGLALKFLWVQRHDDGGDVKNKGTWPCVIG